MSPGPGIVLVHGFKVRDGGARTVDRLAESLREQGHVVDTDTADYGWHFFFSVRFRHDKDVRRIARALETADLVIDHSNGANYTHQALELLGGDGWIDVVHFAPALDRDAQIPRAARKMIVYATPHDKAVKMSRWLLKHPWGDMGRVGYTGTDRRGRTIMDDSVKGHSKWFRKPRMYVTSLLQEIQV